METFTIDGLEGYYQVLMPSVSWETLNPAEIVNQLFIREVDETGKVIDPTLRPLTKTMLANEGFNLTDIVYEIVYNTMRSELLNRGVDPLVLNMPDVEKFIVGQSTTFKPGANQADYINQLSGVLGNVSNDPLQSKKLLSDFEKQLESPQSALNKTIQDLGLGQFPEPRTIDEANQFANEKKRRIQDMVAREQMTPEEAVFENNNVERELEEWDRKFKGISQEMGVASEKARGLQGYYAGAPNQKDYGSELEFEKARVEFYRPVNEAFTLDYVTRPDYGTDWLRKMDIGQSVQYAGYMAGQQAAQRVNEIEEGGQGWVLTEEEIALRQQEEETARASAQKPFRNLVQEAQRNKQRRISS